MSTQYQVQSLDNNGFPIVELSDGQGSVVKIAPHAGFNAFEFHVPFQGENYPVFIGPKDDEDLRAGGFSFGCPILFPFPNRTTEGKYRFQGQDYQLDVNWKDGHAIHGLVADKPWHVDGCGIDENSAWVCGVINLTEYSDIQRQYPFAAELRVTYRLQNQTLILEAEARNVGDKPLPMGFAIHPWFKLPLLPGGQRENCILNVQAQGRWELQSEEQLVPTGEILPLEGEFNFTNGAPLNTVFLDDVFTQLNYSADGRHHVTVTDPSGPLTLDVHASSNFREHVVFAPFDSDEIKDVICLEPYTATTNFVNLAEQGIDAGLVVLQPGETWSGDIKIACS